MSPAQVQTEEQNPLASRQVEVLRLRPGGGRAGRPELQRRCVGPDDRASHPCVCPAAPPAPAGQAAGRVRGELPPGQEASCGVTCSAACPTSSRRSSGTTTRSRGERPELDPRSTSSTTRSRRRSAARRTGLRSRSTRTGSTRTAGGTAPNRRPSGGSKGRIHPPLPPFRDDLLAKLGSLHDPTKPAIPTGAASRIARSVRATEAGGASRADAPGLAPEGADRWPERTAGSLTHRRAPPVARPRSSVPRYARRRCVPRTIRRPRAADALEQGFRAGGWTVDRRAHPTGGDRDGRPGKAQRTRELLSRPPPLHGSVFR